MLTVLYALLVIGFVVWTVTAIFTGPIDTTKKKRK